MAAERLKQELEVLAPGLLLIAFTPGSVQSDSTEVRRVIAVAVRTESGPGTPSMALGKSTLEPSAARGQGGLFKDSKSGLKEMGRTPN